MPRTWQELTAAALATGTFADYHGDGATVPYEMAAAFSTLAGASLEAYKAHLDASYPAAFRLHDWCYTPYGSLINVTRSEADQALRIQIVEIGGPSSFLDAEIVGLAVAVGGEPWFGNSQVGFNPGLFRQVTGAIWRFAAMPTYKLTVGLERTVGAPKAGFTETWYFSRASDEIARNAITGYLSERAKCLSNSWQVGTFVRLSRMQDNCRRFKPANKETWCCVPRVAGRVQCTCPAPLQGRQEVGDQGWDGILVEYCTDSFQHTGCSKCQSLQSAAVRQFIMRGIPDNWYVNGTMNPSPASVADIRGFVDTYIRGTLRAGTVACDDACTDTGDPSCTAHIFQRFQHVCLKEKRAVKRSTGRPFYLQRGRRSRRAPA